ncbi:thiosulfate oxidation carrier protein SoxY [Methylococcus sp. EFPC2]|uniref:thiosulfate oxidation carrier protein SoxY n=1 Tax=Methylococcus sp. EFPC2 TaxID=2812648 RepID=UPI001967CD54|nr:thiosulfate oxidation carrier protein SoxY [Methylococcus sp. EFPC2]QSA98216.1 thiosulfate oxidation carrier protein SoxY [Methylococcus sp. EFPC2]
MRFTRRRFLDNACKCLALAGVTGVPAGWAATRAIIGKPQIPSADLEAAFALETGGQALVESERIVLDAPEVAENGAIVPLSVETSLPDVRSLALFVEKNPAPLAARFEITPELDPFVSLRIKMNESCDVIAVIRSADKYYATRRKVRVVIGGCG